LARLPGEADHTPLERVTLSIASTPTTVSKTPRILDKREEEVEALFDEESGSDKSLDLVNHPSYQDGGNTGNRRRRRRRIGEGDSATNGTASTASSTPSTPSKVKPRLNANRNGEPEKEPPGVSTSTAVPDSSERQERSERHERDRTSSGRTSRREHTPPEKVTVPMTPLEQEIYALMGVSPLVRIERDVKDPKSVLVSVADVDSSEEASDLRESVTELPDHDSDTDPATPAAAAQDVTPSPAEPAADDEQETAEPAKVLVTSASSSKPKKKGSEAASTDSETSSTPRASTGSSGTRRRRRRSSARSGS
jgi:ribonuclease E